MSRSLVFTPLVHFCAPLQVPPQFKLGPLSTVSAGLAMLPRAGKGSTYRKSRLPKERLEIWGYESSPFVKLAREVRFCGDCLWRQEVVSRLGQRQGGLLSRGNSLGGRCVCVCVCVCV